MGLQQKNLAWESLFKRPHCLIATTEREKYSIRYFREMGLGSWWDQTQQHRRSDKGSRLGERRLFDVGEGHWDFVEGRGGLDLCTRLSSMLILSWSEQPGGPDVCKCSPNLGVWGLYVLETELLPWGRNGPGIMRTALLTSSDPHLPQMAFLEPHDLVKVFGIQGNLSWARQHLFLLWLC